MIQKWEKTTAVEWKDDTGCRNFSLLRISRVMWALLQENRSLITCFGVFLWSMIWFSFKSSAVAHIRSPLATHWNRSVNSNKMWALFPFLLAVGAHSFYCYLLKVSKVAVSSITTPGPSTVTRKSVSTGPLKEKQLGPRLRLDFLYVEQAPGGDRSVYPRMWRPLSIPFTNLMSEHHIYFLSPCVRS